MNFKDLIKDVEKALQKAGFPTLARYEEPHTVDLTVKVSIMRELDFLKTLKEFNGQIYFRLDNVDGQTIRVRFSDIKYK